MIFIPQGNTSLITLLGLTNLQTDAYINGATLTVTLLDQNGNAVSSLSGVAMTADGADTGGYFAIVGGSGFAPAIGPGYQLLFQGSSSDGAIKRVTPAIVVQGTI